MFTATTLDLESIIKTKLPPLPGSVLKISSLLQDENVSQRKIAETIGYDPMLASRILRLANSPIYHFEQNVTSLTTAVNAVGNRAIYEMIMLGMIADSFGNEIRNSVIGRDIWLHALAVAIGARELAATLRMHGTEEAFSCGLLHDIGSLLLFRVDSELYTEIFEQCERENTSPMEREIYGFDHAEIGALAAENWHLSESVCAMIRFHHEPSEVPQALMTTHIICIADHLAYAKNQKLPLDGEFMSLPSIVNLGFQTHQLEAVWGKILIQLREIVRTFFR